ncbi:hypothetical protein GOBAR_DD18040 [Gossypium barbadense]|nr:hypothetical protein GOBAR_DD18040 [Gossypium barbadense]
MGLHLDGEASTVQAVSKIDGCDRYEVVVEVGSLENPFNKNGAPSNNTLGLSPMGFSGSGKGLKNKGRGITKKHNKIFHESISASSKANFDSEMLNKSVEKNEGVNLPGQ